MKLLTFYFGVLVGDVHADVSVFRVFAKSSVSAASLHVKTAEWLNRFSRNFASEILCNIYLQIPILPENLTKQQQQQQH
jgi:hypothetical protein